MKKEKGITLVALVVTIIILIILAGISINILVGENGIITKAKQAKQNIALAGEAEALQLNQLYYELETGRELTEDEESTKKDEIIALLQKQVEELQNQVKTLTTENEDLKQQIADLTTQIGTLQTEIEALKEQISQKDIEIEDLKAQVSEKEAKIQELQNQLNNINSLLAQTNATAAQILSGYTAYSQGQLVTGTMANYLGNPQHIDYYRDYNGRYEFAVKEGYHGCWWDGNSYNYMSKEEVASLVEATADKIIAGQTIAGVAGSVDVDAYYNNGYNAGYNDGKSNITFTQVYSGRLGVQDKSPVWTINANVTSISGYQNLTAQNFLFNVTNITGNASGSNASATISKSYDANTGTIKVSVGYNGSGTHAFIVCELICVH